MVGEEVVVDEEQQLAILGLDLLDHVPDPTAVLRPVEVGADRAEGAGETTAAAKLKQGDR